MVKNQKNIEKLAGLALIGAIVVGCGLVLRPLISPILWAAIVCFATWPLYELLLKWFHGRRLLAAGLMTAMLFLVLFIPFLVVGLTFADSIQSSVEWFNTLNEANLPPTPEWVKAIPWIGDDIDESWSRLAENTGPALSKLKPRLRDAGVWLLQHTLDVARGVFYLALSVMVAFFLYLDGEGLVTQLRDGFRRIGGDYGQHLMDVVKKTVQSVVYGMIGTALAQGTVAWIGFALAGVPSALLLAIFTFFVSFIPAGPAVVWIGATIWLFSGGLTGWGVFMIIYGMLVISSIDNVVKPYIISRSSKQPFMVMFIGVVGGVVTFGLIGIFLGPTILAVGSSLTHEILIQRRSAATRIPSNPAE